MSASECQDSAAVICESPSRLCLDRLLADSSLRGRLQARTVPVRDRIRFTQTPALHLSASPCDRRLCALLPPPPARPVYRGSGAARWALDRPSAGEPGGRGIATHRPSPTHTMLRALPPAGLGSPRGEGDGGSPRGAFIGRSSEQMITPAIFPCQKQTHLPRRCPLPWQGL